MKALLYFVATTKKTTKINQTTTNAPLNHQTNTCKKDSTPKGAITVPTVELKTAAKLNAHVEWMVLVTANQPGVLKYLMIFENIVSKKMMRLITTFMSIMKSCTHITLILLWLLIVLEVFLKSWRIWWKNLNGLCCLD